MNITIIATYTTGRARNREAHWFQDNSMLMSFSKDSVPIMHTLERKTFAPMSLFVRGDQVEREHIHDILYALTVDLIQNEYVSATVLLEDDQAGTLSSLYTFSSGPGMADYTITKKFWVKK